LARALSLTLAALSFSANAAAHEETWFAAAEAQADARAALTRPEPGAALVPLRIVLRDAASGAEIAGNVRVTTASGALLALDLAEPRPCEPRPNGWHATAGAILLQAPPEKLRIEAFQGLETTISAREVDLSARVPTTVELSLARFASAAELGLASGNTHLHLMGWPRARVEAYLRDATAADQLDFAWVSRLERFDSEVPYTTNELTRGELERLSTAATRFGWGEELRHNFGEYSIGYGHVLLLDLERLVLPVSIGPVLAGTPHDAPGLAPGMAEARAQAATVIWAHGQNGYEDLPSWLLGRVDAQNLFDGAAPGEVLRGDHATYASVYYPLLDVGLAVPFSTGTDWFIGDLARVYVPLAGERSSEAFLAQLREGHSFITNGPLLELDVRGEGPGGSVKLAAPGSVPARARAIGRASFGALELIASGQVVARADARAVGDHFEAELAQDVALDESAWLAARIAPGEARNEFGKPLFAHSSAVTVEIAGARPFHSDVARALVLEMDWNARTIRAKGHFASAAQADEVTAPYAEAIDALAPRMTWRDRLQAFAVRVLRTLKAWLGL
jgi:hypothetical protein